MVEAVNVKLYQKLKFQQVIVRMLGVLLLRELGAGA